MRVVLVNHTFPPASWAGSEICVLRSAQELQRRGHEPHIFTRDASPDREEYALEYDRVEGVPVTRITKNFRFVRDFDDIYRDDIVAARFGDWVGGLAPDVVHIHHLTNLSTTLPHELFIRGIPTLMTLHDYWLHCQRGQLLTRRLQRCDGPSISGCRDCLAVQVLRGKAQRLVGGLVSGARKVTRPDPSHSDLVFEEPQRIETPDRSFVGHVEIEMAGFSGTVLQAHPPSTLVYEIHPGPATRLEVSYGMFPSTYDAQGDGVRFSIEVAGERVLDEFVDAKNDPAHRRGFETALDLGRWAGETTQLRCITAAEPTGNVDFCAAGWGKLRLTGLPTAHQTGQRNGAPWAKKIVAEGLHGCARLGAALFPSATHAIQRRRLSVQEVLQQVDRFVSPSNFLRDFFIRQGLDPEKIVFLDNGFQTTDRARPAPWQPGTRPLRVGYLGTWIPPKGVDLLVEAFNGLPEGAAELHIHGFFPGYDGHETYEEELRAAARHSGIHFHGPYPPERGPEILAEVDIIVVPSIWWENSPLTIHEAFQAGVPVVAADVGGMAEFVPHETGGLQFRHRDSASLRDTLLRLLEEPGLLERIGKGVPGVMSIEEHVDRLLVEYRRTSQAKKNPWKHPVEF